MKIMLHGGSDGLDKIVQVQEGAIPEQVTVDFCGRHEHFVRTGEMAATQGMELPVFLWSYSAAIAE